MLYGLENGLVCISQRGILSNECKLDCILDVFFDNLQAQHPLTPGAPVQQQINDSVDGGDSFFIGENEASPPAEETKQEEEKEEPKTEEEPSKEAEQPERKTSFWSGLWNRNKDHGSKENILEDSDKKTSEQKTEDGE